MFLKRGVTLTEEHELQVQHCSRILETTQLLIRPKNPLVDHLPITPIQENHLSIRRHQRQTLAKPLKSHIIRRQGHLNLQELHRPDFLPRQALQITP